MVAHLKASSGVIQFQLKFVQGTFSVREIKSPFKTRLRLEKSFKISDSKVLRGTFLAHFVLRHFAASKFLLHSHLDSPLPFSSVFVFQGVCFSSSNKFADFKKPNDCHWIQVQFKQDRHCVSRD